MKRLFYTCLAALSVAAYAAPGAEEPAAPQQPAPAAEEPTDADEEKEEAAPADSADPMAAILEKEKLVDTLYNGLERKSRHLTTRYENHKKDVAERLKKIEEAKQKLEEAKAACSSYATAEYEFAIVSESDRDLYAREAGELARQAMASLSAKSDAERIKGLRKYAPLRESYQGLPEFKELNALYQKVVLAFEKKWNSTREAMRRERQKWASSRLDKTETNEKAQLDDLASKMEAEELDIDEDWFLPKTTNSFMLDRALEHVRRAKGAFLTSKNSDMPTDVPTLMSAYWRWMDDVKALFRRGDYEEALNKVGEDEPLREITGAPRAAMPESYKENYRKQTEDLRNAIRERQRAQRDAERKLSLAQTSYEREMDHLDKRVDPVLETLEEAKAEEEQRAEEAAREAEEEARRAAEEAEEDDEEADAPKEPKPKKKKSGKKKKKQAGDAAAAGEAEPQEES